MTDDRTPVIDISSEDDFRRVMEDVDQELRQEGVPIPAREIEGIRRVSGARSMNLTIVPLPDRPPREGCYTGDDLSLRIVNWFNEHYGDRLNVDYSIGTTIIKVREDLYRIRVALVYGQVNFICDPTNHGKDVYPRIGKGQPAIVNVLDLIDGLTSAISQTLSNSELQQILEVYVQSHKALQDVNELGGFGFVREAQGDLRASVQHLFETVTQNGLSKWASLQATEKLFKTFLQRKDIPFPKNFRGHDLSALMGLAQSAGLPSLAPRLLAKIQCSAGVRYGDPSVTKQEAFEAHRAALTCCGAIARSMK